MELSFVKFMNAHSLDELTDTFFRTKVGFQHIAVGKIAKLFLCNPAMSLIISAPCSQVKWIALFFISCVNSHPND
jgi:hypothetical protein